MSTESEGQSEEFATKPSQDHIWQSFGIDAGFLESNAAWLGEKRGLHGRVLSYFAVAGSLIRFSRYDYKLASAAFFHAVLGLEKALKLHYRAEDARLQELMNKALGDRLIVDVLFGQVPAFTDGFAPMVSKRLKGKPGTHAELLVQLIPAFRNDYMHGEYLLAPDFLHLTLQIRKIADHIASD